MARPASWLPRLHEIHRAVSNSIRSHYTRRELESLFELQPRAAQKLIELLPVVAVGTSRLVERDAILTFLEGVNEAEDTTAYFERVRLAKAAVGHKKIRSLVRRDTTPLTIASLPDSIRLIPGRLEVSFGTVEQLAAAMYALARVLEAEGDAFAQAYEPELPPEVPEDAVEIDALFAELEAMERERASRTAIDSGSVTL